MRGKIGESNSTERIKMKSRAKEILTDFGLQKRLFIRSKMIQNIRKYLDKEGFVEMDTPILNSTANGANAKPFTISDNLHLRIAPELNLKQLVIGGFDKVYEIGKQFRNEGVDATHLPEFLSLEFYRAYSNLEDTMDFVRDLLKTIIFETIGTTKVGNVDFDDFQVVDILSFLESNYGTLPETEEELILYCKNNSVPIPNPVTHKRLLESIIEHKIESKCLTPTFLVGHPEILSPLANVVNGKSRRFELFVNKKELVNAYEELNDAKEQRRRFKQQSLDREKGDDEAPIPDEDYCTALEYGLPPTTGCGIGLDRLCMLITDAKRIQEITPFP